MQGEQLTPVWYNSANLEVTMAAGIYQRLDNPTLDRVVIIDGHYIDCKTNGKIQDGLMAVQITKEALWPIRDKFTLSSTGFTYDSMSMLLCYVDASEVLIPITVIAAYNGWKYQHNRGEFPKLDKGEQVWPPSLFGPSVPWWMAGKPGRSTFTSQG